MALDRDPEGIETEYLKDYVGSGARVLEIGAGDGRLTWRYIQRASQVVAVDPAEEDLILAERDCPPDARSKLSVVAAMAEALPLPPASFDLAILSWSL